MFLHLTTFWELSSVFALWDWVKLLSQYQQSYGFSPAWIREETHRIWYKVMNGIALVQYVHEFLKLLWKRLYLYNIVLPSYKGKYYTCTMCTWVFKVIREKIMLVRYVHEFLQVFHKIILVLYNMYMRF